MFKILFVAIVAIFCFSLHPVSAAYKCFKCKGENCQNHKILNHTMECLRDDRCVSVFEGFTLLGKGCYSEMPQGLQEICQNHSATHDCHICPFDYCNNKGPQKCIECDWKQKGELCFYNAHIIPPTFCPTSSTKCFVSHSLYTKRKWANIVRGCVTQEFLRMHSHQSKDIEMKEKYMFCDATPKEGCNIAYADVEDFKTEPIAIVYKRYRSNGVNDNSDAVLVILLICFCYVVTQFFFHL